MSTVAKVRVKSKIYWKFDPFINIMCSAMQGTSVRKKKVLRQKEQAESVKSCIEKLLQENRGLKQAKKQ